MPHFWLFSLSVFSIATKLRICFHKLFLKRQGTVDFADDLDPG